MTVESPEPVEVETTAEGEGETIGAEIEEEGPTGFALSPEMLPDVIIVVGFLSAGIIFLFRDNVTNTFHKIGRSRGLTTKMGPTEIEEQKKKIELEKKIEVKKISKEDLSKTKTVWIDRAKTFYNKYNCTLNFGVKRQPEIKSDEEKK